MKTLTLICHVVVLLVLATHFTSAAAAKRLHFTVSACLLYTQVYTHAYDMFYKSKVAHKQRSHDTHNTVLAQNDTKSVKAIK